MKKATERRSDEATKGNVKAQRALLPLRRSVAPSLRRSAFSLTEILIVIAIIVLILALAMPAFNFITGGRSADAAMNQISAFLARARTEAVGVQEPRGVLFYLDPATDREMMVLVKPTPTKEAVDSGNNSAVDVWLGLASNEDHLALPKGVGIQLANDSSGGSTLTGWERYIGFNQFSGASASLPSDASVGGVIMFDAYGRLASLHYGFRLTDNASSKLGTPSDLGKLLFASSIQNTPGTTLNDETITLPATPNVAPLTAFGFLLFDRNLAEEKFGTGFNKDPFFVQNAQIPSGNVEAAEESWLDSNATPVLINRYNGTLVKGE